MTVRADDDATQKLGLDIKIVSTYSDGFFPLGRPTINSYSYQSIRLPRWTSERGFIENY